MNEQSCRREGIPDVHVEELLGDETLLVVQRVEFPSVSSVVVMMRPILECHEEMEPGLPHRPVLHNIPP